MRYSKADIKQGMFLTGGDYPVMTKGVALDRSQVREGMLLYGGPVPSLTKVVPKYGDEQPFAEVSRRLEEARKRLEEIREGVRRARR